jgi:hypothetical protein
MSKILLVSYHDDEIYHLPDWLDLEDDKQVQRYIVKYSVLHVLLTNGKWVKILPQYEVDIDTRYGDNNEVRDAEDFGIEFDGEPKWEYDNEEEEEEEDNPAKIAKKVMCDVIDKVKAEAEAKAEAANLTRTSVINPKHICGLTGGECHRFKGCGKEVDMDETNMIGNTSFCIPCYEKLEEFITDENSEDENSDDEDEDEDEDE